MSENLRNAPICERCEAVMNADWREQKVVGWYCRACNAEGSFEHQIEELIGELEKGSSDDAQGLDDLSDLRGKF